MLVPSLLPLLKGCYPFFMRFSNNIHVYKRATASSIARSGHSDLPWIVVGRWVRRQEIARGSRSITGTSAAIHSSSCCTMRIDPCTERSVAVSKLSGPMASSAFLICPGAQSKTASMARQSGRNSLPKLAKSSLRRPGIKRIARLVSWQNSTHCRRSRVSKWPCQLPSGLVSSRGTLETPGSLAASFCEQWIIMARYGNGGSGRPCPFSSVAHVARNKRAVGRG